MVVVKPRTNSGRYILPVTPSFGSFTHLMFGSVAFMIFLRSRLPLCCKLAWVETRTIVLVQRRDQGGRHPTEKQHGPTADQGNLHFGHAETRPDGVAVFFHDRHGHQV